MKKITSLVLVIVFCLMTVGSVNAAGSTYKIAFDSNGGSGTMQSVKYTIGTATALPANKYTRTGYRFRGWNTKKDGTGIGYEDQGAIGYNGEASVKLYAFWEPQVYKIHFDGNGATSGTMLDQLIQYDTSTGLKPNTYVKEGYVFGGWMDSSGNIYSNAQVVSNLRKCKMRSEKIVTLSAGSPQNKSLKFKSVQGSCIYTKDGHKYAVYAASINDSSYYAGDLSHYETEIIKYDMTSGKTVATARNLQFDHGNGICYNPNNSHIYIAEGGTLAGYPSAIMELDENLNYVTTINLAGVSNVYSIAFNNNAFYVLGKSSAGSTCIYVVNQNYEIISSANIDAAYQAGYCAQGIAADDSFIYEITACFDSYKWKNNQKVNVFTLSGTYVGTWSIDVAKEVEDITIDNGTIYISTNEGNKTTIYKSYFPNVTLKAIWTKA